MKLVKRKYLVLFTLLFASKLLCFELYNSDLVESENWVMPFMPGQFMISQKWQYELNFVLSSEKSLSPRNNLKLSYLMKISPSSDKNKLKANFLEFYMSTEIFPGFFIDIGKFVVRNGTGYFKSPTDFFNVRWNLSKSHRKQSSENLSEGIVAIKNEFFLRNGIDIQFLFSPKICWDTVEQKTLSYLSSPQKENQLFASISFMKFKNVDTKFLVLHNDYLYFGLNWNLTRGNNLELHGDFSVSEKVFNKTVNVVSNGDSTIYLIQTDSVKYPLKALIGCVYTFSDQSTLTLEYFYNGRGVEGSDYDNIINYMQMQFTQYQSPDAFSILESYGTAEFARHYIFERFYHEFKAEKLYIEFMNLNNLQDLSGVFFARFGKITDVSNLSLGFQIFYGDDDTEYGVIPTNWKMALEAEFVIF